MRPHFATRDRLINVAIIASGLALTVLIFVLAAPSEWWA
jgi:hypothetical protein